MSDLISRQAVLDTLKGFNVVDIISYEHGVIYVQAVINAIYNRLNNLPSAEPERTAKVENIEDPAGMGAYGDCSECGAEVNEQYAYCPNCGAKLDWSK